MSGWQPTVAEMIEELQKYPPDSRLRFCTASDDEVQILSVYRIAEDRATPKLAGVWLDLGAAE